MLLPCHSVNHYNLVMEARSLGLRQYTHRDQKRGLVSYIRLGLCVRFSFLCIQAACCRFIFFDTVGLLEVVIGCHYSTVNKIATELATDLEEATAR